LFSSLSGGQELIKLDLAHAYLQVPLEEESKKYTTINTHQGLYQYIRLPFGISSAPAIFQRIIENFLEGVPHTCIYLDEILLTGKTKSEHFSNLAEVLTRLEKAGLCLKQEKCSFMLPSIDCLGDIISANSLQPTKEKVHAITDAPIPGNVSQLCSFLGLVNYCSKFLPHLATLAPLYFLLQKSKWHWGEKQKQAFEEAKSQISSTVLIAHFNPDCELHFTFIFLMLTTI